MFHLLSIILLLSQSYPLYLSHHSYLSLSFLTFLVYLFSLSIILIYLYSLSKLINHLLRDLSFILVYSSLTFYSSSIISALYVLTNFHSSLLSSSQIFEMEQAFKNLKRTYPNMPRDVLKLIYKYRLKRSRVLIKSGFLRDI